MLNRAMHQPLLYKIAQFAPEEQAGNADSLMQSAHV
jgi:hypothetical protein